MVAGPFSAEFKIWVHVLASLCAMAMLPSFHSYSHRAHAFCQEILPSCSNETAVVATVITGSLPEYKPRQVVFFDQFRLELNAPGTLSAISTN